MQMHDTKQLREGQPVTLEWPADLYDARSCEEYKGQREEVKYEVVRLEC